MAKDKNFCTSSNSDLVKKLKTMYGLSKKQAKTVIDTARRNSPALQADNITWDFMVSQPEFQKALSVFTGKNITLQKNNSNGNADRQILAGRFSAEELSGSSGILEKAEALLQRGDDSSIPEESQTKYGRKDLGERQEIILEKFAKENNLWIDNTTDYLKSKYEEHIREGGEARIYRKDSKTLIKELEITYFVEPQLALDRIVLHNSFAGSKDAPLNLVKFGRNENGNFVFIVEQPYIKGRHATTKEIVSFMENAGFSLYGNAKFSSEFKRDDIIINDLHNENAIITPDGYFVIIDAEFRINTSNYGIGGTRTTRTLQTTISEITKETNRELGDNFTEEQIKEMQNRAAEVIDQNKASKISAKDIKDLLDTFKDPQRLTFLGDWMMHYAHRMVTEIMTNAKYRDNLHIAPNASRKDIYMNISANNLIRKNILAQIDEALEINSDDAEKTAELNYAKSHLNNMLFMFGSQLYRWDGIGVDKEGNFFVPGSRDYLSEEENNTQDQNVDGEHPRNDFSSSDQNEPVDTKIVPEIKSLLTDLVEKGFDGEEWVDWADSHYSSFSIYMPVQQTINKLLTICQGCSSFNEMSKRLEAFRRSTPWIGDLLDILDSSTENSGFESSNTTKSRKEQLQTQFFVSFNKYRTDFVNTYTTKENAVMTRDISERSNARKLYGNVLSRYRRHAGLNIFDNGVFDLEALKNIYNGLKGGPREDGSVLNKIQKARAASADVEKAYEMLSKVEKDLLGKLNLLGIDATEQMMDDYLAAEIEGRDFQAFIKRSDRLSGLHKKMLALAEEMQNLDATDNPFERYEDEPDYRWKIRKDFRDIIDSLTEYSPDSFESMYYGSGKGFYSWNYPSTVQTILSKLNQKDRKAAQDYIMRKYGKDAVWFLKDGSTQDDPHFYSDWLEDLYHGAGNISVKYKEKPVSFGKSYSELSDREYTLSLINDFMQRQDGKTNESLYRMIISSDKPRYALVKAPRRSKDYILDKAQDFFAQEMNRAIDLVRFAVSGKGTRIKNYDIKDNNVIKKIRNSEKITIDDVLEDGRYVFRNTGASFFLNKFLNDEIEKKSPLGEYIVDRIFNADSHVGEKLITPEAITLFKESFNNYMIGIASENLNYSNSIGIFDSKQDEDGNIHSKTVLPMLKNWHGVTDREWLLYQQKMYSDVNAGIAYAKYLDDLDIDANDDRIQYYCELAAFAKDLGDFCWNNWLAKANMMQVFDVDPAFYGNTTNYQKREAQIISAGIVADPEAMLHGKAVSDRKYRSITIKTNKLVSDVIDNIKTMLQKQADAISDKNQKAQFIQGMNDTLAKLSKMDVTDGQAFTGLTALRKRLVGRGEWSRSDNSNLDNTGYIEKDGVRKYIFTDEAVYQRLKRGYKTKEDRDAKAYDLAHVFAEPQKPFMFGFTEVNRAGRTVTVPTQHKNSEYQLSFLTAFAIQERDKSRTDKKLSQVEALAIFLEESAQDDATKGIDTVNWDSGVKIGENSDSIDLNGLDGYQTLEKLRESVYGSKDAEANHNNYQTGVVSEYDIEDYKITSNKPEHFRDFSQPMGTQMKVLSVANTDDNAQIKLPNGKTISGKELKTRYLKALEEKTKRAETEFFHDMGLDLPRDDRMHRLSNVLKRLMASDQRFDAEMRHALGVTEKDGELQFNIPLDEPGLQQSIEAMIYSKIRQVYYRQATSGGIVVQASSWGRERDIKNTKYEQSDNLNIRFFSSNPKDKDGLIPVKKEWIKTHPNENYEDYCKKYQKGYAFFEFEAPMPDYIKKMLSNENGKIKDKYFNPDGSWNMDAIRKTVPASAFDAICYRIPTQAKYSIMVCKLVRFTNNEGGNVCRYPKELTTFTDSDFDIDTDVIELRPQPGKPNRDVDSEIFNMQMASLQSDGSLQETFHAGDFSDLSKLSYKVRLWENGIDPDTVSDLKQKCMDVEDLDIMDPLTDILLRQQNMEAKDLIGIAAVGVTSHAFFSLYNSSPANSIRVNFRGAQKKNDVEEESINVINDHNGSNLTLGGYMTLDGNYDMDGKLISLEIGKYVGASADAAKDAALYRLGINKTTLPVVITMHRLGVSSDIARLFAAQPIIKELSDRIVNGNSKNAADVCDELAKSLETYEGQWDDIRFAPATLRLSGLEKNIKDNSDVEDQLMMLHVFKTLHKISRSVNNLDSYVRYNSARAMDGSSVLGRYATRRKLDTLESTLGSDDARIKLPDSISKEGLDGLAEMFPYISMAITGEEELADGLLKENMKTYNSSFWNFAERLLGENDASAIEDTKALKTLYNAWKSYMLFNGEYKIADFSDKDTVKKYTVQFPYIYADTIDKLSQDKDFYNKVINSNSFLKSIGYVPSATRNYDLLSTDVNGISGEALEKYKADWASLLNHPETKQLAIDLGIYFLARSSDYNAATPVHLIPVQVKEAIGNYLDVFSKADEVNLNSKEIWDFLKKFQRNNFANGKIVPQLYNINGAKDYTIDKVDGKNVLHISEDKSKTVLRWCEDLGEGPEHEYYMRMPIVNVNGAIYEIVNDPLEVDDNGMSLVLKKKVEPLGVPGEFSEYTGLDDTVFGPQEYADPEAETIEPPAISEEQAMDIADGVVKSLSENTMNELRYLFNGDGFKFSENNLKGLIANLVNSNLQETKESFMRGGMSKSTADELFGTINNELIKRNAC